MRLLGLIVALVIGFGSYLFLQKLMHKEEAPQAVPIVETKYVEKKVVTKNIIAASMEIPVGTRLEAKHLKVQPWPEELVLPHFVLADRPVDAPKDEQKVSYGMESLVGLVTRSNFQVNEPMIRSKLGNPDDPSFLAASLESGMRAVTIRTSGLNGVSGFVYPGDKVDLLLNFKLDLDGAAAGFAPQAEGRKASVEVVETILSNVKVIAVDQKAMSHTGEPPRAASAFTLALNQFDAQKVKLAEKMGTVIAVLRSIEDGEDTSIPRPTLEADLTRLTPPAYIPVMYDQNSDYVIPTVDLFGAVDGLAENDPALKVRRLMEGLSSEERAQLSNVFAQQGVAGAIGYLKSLKGNAAGQEIAGLLAGMDANTQGRIMNALAGGEAATIVKALAGIGNDEAARELRRLFRQLPAEIQSDIVRTLAQKGPKGMEEVATRYADNATVQEIAKLFNGLSPARQEEVARALAEGLSEQLVAALNEVMNQNVSESLRQNMGQFGGDVSSQIAERLGGNKAQENTAGKPSLSDMVNEMDLTGSGSDEDKGISVRVIRGVNEETVEVSYP